MCFQLTEKLTELINITDLYSKDANMKLVLDKYRTLSI